MQDYQPIVNAIGRRYRRTRVHWENWARSKRLAI